MGKPTPGAADLYYVDLSIAAGSALSAAASISSMHPCGLLMPSAWDAAAITVQVSRDNQIYLNLYDQAGSEVAIQAGASRFIVLNPALFAGFEWLKLRSGLSSAPVNQTAARAPALAVRPYR